VQLWGVDRGDPTPDAIRILGCPAHAQQQLDEPMTARSAPRSPVALEELA
jgi:hypothetical protein